MSRFSLLQIDVEVEVPETSENPTQSFDIHNIVWRRIQLLAVIGMHRNENSWPKLKTENEETKAENQNTEINYYANFCKSLYVGLSQKH